MITYCLLIFGGPAGTDVIATYGPFFSFSEAATFGNSKVTSMPPQKYIPNYYVIYPMSDPYQGD